MKQGLSVLNVNMTCLRLDLDPKLKLLRALLILVVSIILEIGQFKQVNYSKVDGTNQKRKHNKLKNV